jgi:uncharacterized protein
MNAFKSYKPEIHYPCRWQFRLIGENRDAMCEAIRSLVNIADYEISEGNVSSHGRYIGLNLELAVNDEADRLRFYQVFSRHPAIRIVL